MALPESLGVTDLPAYALFAQRRPIPASPVVVRPRRDTVPPRPPTTEEILTMLRSDLRAVTIAEEAAVHRTGEYETELEHLHLSPSDGVRLQLVSATSDGWSAIASHPSLPGLTCVVFAGDLATPPATAKEGRRGPPGEVVCDR